MGEEEAGEKERRRLRGVFTYLVKFLDILQVHLPLLH